MLTSGERKQMQNFQEALGELVDQYIKEGMPTDRIRKILLAEDKPALNERAEELTGLALIQAIRRRCPVDPDVED